MQKYVTITLYSDVKEINQDTQIPPQTSWRNSRQFFL